jgi:hypothetical protein
MSRGISRVRLILLLVDTYIELQEVAREGLEMKANCRILYYSLGL